MLQLLSAAGFFAIRWPLFPAAALPGATYVLPTPRGVVRAFVPADGDELELYTGRLLTGRLCYRGPLASGVELRHLLAKAA